jgi:hypothetical protein
VLAECWAWALYGSNMLAWAGQAFEGRFVLGVLFLVWRSVDSHDQARSRGAGPEESRGGDPATRD